MVLFFEGMPTGLQADDRYFSYTFYELLVHALLHLEPRMQAQYSMGGMQWMRATYTLSELQSCFFRHGTHTRRYGHKEWLEIAMRITHA